MVHSIARLCLIFLSLLCKRVVIGPSTTDAVLTTTDAFPANASDANGTSTDCFDSTCGYVYSPLSALIKCQYLTEEFVDCEEPKDLSGNSTAKAELGYGCTKFGGQRYEDVERTRVWCTALAGIECFGDRRFLSLGEHPCIKYTGHYFLSTLIYSVLLGFLGIDRFCLGHTGTAVGKLLTLGGVGVWWIIDVILLVTGNLGPADDSNWEPYY